MRLKFSGICSLIFLSVNLFAQQKLNKAQIREKWISTNQKSILADTIENLAYFDAGLNNRILRIYDSLRKTGIDTVGIFAISNPGIIQQDKCLSAPYPTTLYLYWVSAGKTFKKRMFNYCDEAVVAVKHSAMLDYYAVNRNSMKAEFVMPVIYGADSISETMVRFHLRITTHESIFFMFCAIGDEAKYLHFDLNALENKESLFYHDNLNSFSYAWYKAVRKEIEAGGD